MTVETKKYEDSVVEKNKIKNWFARQGLPLLSIELRTYKYLPLTDTEIMTEKLQELNRQLNKRTGNLKFIIRITHVVIDCKNWTTWMLKVVNQINFTMLFLSKNIEIRTNDYVVSYLKDYSNRNRKKVLNGLMVLNNKQILQNDLI